MSSYGRLADSYDLFTADVEYSVWADYYEEIFRRFHAKPEMILDLACGTGSLTVALAQRGYDMIGVDASSDMLAVAMQKTQELPAMPLFLCQRMEELDLYGTVDAAICALDSLNYLTSAAALRTAFARLRFFVRPGGLVIFDVNTEAKFRAMDGESYLRDEENHFCAWSAEYDENTRLCRMMMDIFDRDGALWARSSEEHIERAHSEEELHAALRDAGFRCLARWDALSFRDADAASQRVFWVAERGEQA